MTENHPGLRDLVISILTQKNLKVHLSTGDTGEFLKFSNNPHNGKDYQLWANNIDLGSGDCVKITLMDFIQQINELPDKDKEICVTVSGGEIVKIEGDNVIVGCQTFSKENIKKLKDIVMKSQEQVITFPGNKGISLSFSGLSIRCDGSSFTEGDLDKVIAAF